MSFFYFSDDVTADESESTPTGVAVLSVGGELDYAASPQLKERIAAAIKPGPRHLVLDLSAATFIDSTAIGVLVGAATKLRDDVDGSLTVVCTNHNVLQIFELTGLDGLIALHDTREEALSALTVVG